MLSTCGILAQICSISLNIRAMVAAWQARRRREGPQFRYWFAAPLNNVTLLQ